MAELLAAFLGLAVLYIIVLAVRLNRLENRYFNVVMTLLERIQSAYGLQPEEVSKAREGRSEALWRFSEQGLWERVGPEERREDS